MSSKKSSKPPQARSASRGEASQRPSSRPQSADGGVLNATTMSSMSSLRSQSSTEGALNRTLMSSTSTLSGKLKAPKPDGAKKQNLFKLSEKHLVYNKYLQALMKQQLAIQVNKKHKEQVNKEFGAKLQELAAMQDTRDEINRTIDEADNKLAAMVEFKRLQENLHLIEEIYTQRQPLDKVREFKALLEAATERTALINTKPLESQEQYKQLEENFKELGKLLELILTNQDGDMELLNEVAEAWRELGRLQEEVQQLLGCVTKIRDENSAQLLKMFSDKFAEQYQ